jgi:hypothetical protein
MECVKTIAAETRMLLPWARRFTAKIATDCRMYEYSHSSSVKVRSFDNVRCCALQTYLCAKIVAPMQRRNLAVTRSADHNHRKPGATVLDNSSAANSSYFMHIAEVVSVHSD